ncbi:hypothetical protein JXQ70_19550 [bacterium]|nr:hypothetical protein [bacterium]
MAASSSGNSTKPERWSMHFWYDAQNDVVTMTFKDCIILTPQDATDFMKVVFEHIQRHKTPTDVLIDYSGLTVKGAAMRQFGVERSGFGRLFVKHSFRFHVSSAENLAIQTSSILDGAEVNIYRTRDEALAALLALRAKQAAEKRGTAR